ncbi:GNAT family N-acetyltransferase [Haliscomenobacter hydrossis]|uniref:GCN5-related N-acetyltransferase n=1 Tax=Haliscomenobacter hydrossis (strain ATCC 27775 / DSM 1100 / LMG 10767 / O) TaxID=760192 RepID=F4L4V9_HALH1|nr:GNAT family N-acetyltransferase [Haliscomenobacter hydrossis]AEE54021.1 GCN5-related N-acetyltransferase [Haliscomenobacter hydrossis DSM 1100]
MIETYRLKIQPLTYAQLQKYVQNDQSLEKELNLKDSSRNISPELVEALEQTILPNVADGSKNYLYSTLWTVISKADRQMVADLCFVGEPDANGQIELGFGTYERHEGQGYMTEAVAGMIKWAKEQPAVKSIYAETAPDNFASMSVLKKNGFVQLNKKAALCSWKLVLPID